VTVLQMSRITVIWLLLVAATLLSWEIGHGIGGWDARIGGTAIMVVAFVKVRFVMFDFMEIRGAPTWMRRATDGWIVVISAVLIARILVTG
jgi:hypothetical protein